MRKRRVTIHYLIKKLNKYMNKAKIQNDGSKMNQRLSSFQKSKAEKKWDKSQLISIPEVNDDITNKFGVTSRHLRDYDKILAKKDVISLLLSRQHKVFEQRRSSQKQLIPEYYTEDSTKNSNIINPTSKIENNVSSKFLLTKDNFENIGANCSSIKERKTNKLAILKRISCQSLNTKDSDLSDQNKILSLNKFKNYLSSQDLNYNKQSTQKSLSDKSYSQPKSQISKSNSELYLSSSPGLQTLPSFMTKPSKIKKARKERRCLTIDQIENLKHP